MRRLHRVTATWPDGTVTVRHYQSKRAAEERRQRMLAGYGETTPDGERVGYSDVATTAVVESSNPITWPESP